MGGDVSTHLNSVLEKRSGDLTSAHEAAQGSEFSMSVNSKHARDEEDALLLLGMETKYSLGQQHHEEFLYEPRQNTDRYNTALQNKTWTWL